MANEKRIKLTKDKCPTCRLTLLAKPSVKVCPACRGRLGTPQRVGQPAISWAILVTSSVCGRMIGEYSYGLGWGLGCSSRSKTTALSRGSPLHFYKSETCRRPHRKQDPFALLSRSRLFFGQSWRTGRSLPFPLPLVAPPRNPRSQRRSVRPRKSER
jgi:hypothetical protein